MKTRPCASAVKLPRMLRVLCGCFLAFSTQLAAGQVSSVHIAAPTSSAIPPESATAETALALSACPPEVAKGAAVYVLGRSGYERVRDSRNGFTAIVQHTVPTAQEPRCMDAEGTRTWLPRILMVAELRAHGKSQEEIQKLVADAVAKGLLQPPRRFGVDYMLSTKNRVPNEKGVVTPFPPHVMFYAPYLTNADIGVDRTNLGPDGNPVGPAFVAGDGSPYALIIVPVGPHSTTDHTMLHCGSDAAE